MNDVAMHLLLRAEDAPSPIAVQLGAAGYVVSKVDDDAIAERLAAAPHIHGIVIDLPAMAAIRFGRRLESTYGSPEFVTLIVTRAAETLRHALPWATVLARCDAADDLVTTIDLALARTPRRLSPGHRADPPLPRSRVA